MRRRAEPGRRWWLPWLLAAVALLIAAAAEAVVISDEGEGFAADMHPVVALLPFMLATAFAFIGGLILRERPGHGLGRLLAWFGLVFAVGVLTDNYAYHQPPLPGREWMGLVSGVGYFFFVIPLVALTPLLFPTGSLPSRRWRWPVALAAFGVLVMVAGNLVDPTINEEIATTNPLGVEALAPWIGTITGLGMIPVAVLAVAGLVDLIRRFRRSTGVLRLQMRWFAMGATVVFFAFVGLALAYEFVSIELALTIFAIGAPALPISIGVAVLRYRLFDIDGVISRTVTYGLVTLTLVGIYVVVVVGLGGLVRGVAGGGGGDLVVAASTLAVAAAFGPVRRRVQTVVDRRFNRARYDAARTVEAFAQTLRDEVQLDDLLTSLNGITTRTLGAQHVHLWLARQDVR
jgi:hypothetical protein